MQSWKPDRLLKAILIWTMITAITIWLPLIRGLMDGSTYQWGSAFWGFQLGGRGIGGDYWVLVLLTMLQWVDLNIALATSGSEKAEASQG